MLIVDSYIELPFQLNKTLIETVRNPPTTAFLAGNNLTNMSLMKLISTIDQNVMGAMHLIYGVMFIMTLKYKVQGLNKEANYAVVLQLVAIYCVSYVIIHQSKMLFVTKKQLEKIMNEQRNIVKNLPDGIIIAKKL